ncbi:Membrane protein [Parelusimicrobium proximum]|uniref:NfeD family protein n=1 Tax=Parelusimicrobium proximum TaxID=3228953 RepID=UPI003D1794D9
MSAFYIWLIIGVVLLLVEILTPTFASMCFAAGAFAAAIAAWLGMGTAWQLVMFSVFSLAFFFSLRPILRKHFLKSPEVKTNADGMAGKKGKVTDKISPDNPGRVTIDGDSWRALPVHKEEIKQGAEVVVEKLEGVTIYVKKIN